MIPETLGAALLAACGGLAWGVRGRSSPLFGPVARRGLSGRRSVALTFDDGPSESTPRFLDVLASKGARATFFQCGVNARRLPEVARTVADEGHEIGNHSETHAAWYLRSPAFIHGELEQAQRTLTSITGRNPRLCRAPYGTRWFGVRAAQKRLSLLNVTWTVIGLDWRLPADSVARRVLRFAEPGAIVCLHDGRETQANPDVRESLAAAAIIVQELRSRGFEFETVSEILCPTI